MQFSPYALITFAAAFGSALVAYAIWQRRPGVSVIPFVVLSSGTAIWAFFSAVELLLTDPNLIFITTLLSYVGITLVPAGWLVFALTYTGHDQWINRRALLLLIIEPIALLVLILTNNLHHLFWTSREPQMIAGYFAINYTYGPLFWVHAVYSYGFLAIGTFFLFRAFARSPQLYREQIFFLGIASFVPWIANAIYLLKLSPLPSNVDLTPIAFGVTAISTAWSLYRYRLMDIVPVGRETIIDNMDDAIFILDGQDRIVDINRAALRELVQTADDVIGQHASTVLLGNTSLIDRLQSITEANADVTIDRNGLMRAFNLRITPLKNRQQEVSGRIIVMHDISTLQETNRQLRIATDKAEEAARLKSQFLATMSHELRTPLNAIIGYTEIQLLGMAGELNDQQYEYQERVLANSKHLLGLINDILDLSKIDAGRMVLLIKSFQVRSWLDEIARENAILAQEKGLEFYAKVSETLPDTLLGDSARLRQVVVNLISNGIKFTKNGKVSVELRTEDEKHWAIEVCDTGVGIPPHKQETIFTEFYQLDNSTTREYGGTGLGLAIVRRLVTAMNGTIRVTSALGEGSTFTVIFPIIEPTTAGSV